MTLREQMLAIQASLTGKAAPQRPAMASSATAPATPIFSPGTPDIEEDEYYSILDYMRRNGKFINRR